jgi:hypothetical protein
MIEPKIIMLGRSFNNVVIGGVGLDDNFSSFDPTPCPASYLTQKLKSALATSEIRKIQASISVDYSSQGHLRQVQPLGYHLSANKHISFVVTKIS